MGSKSGNETPIDRQQFEKTWANHAARLSLGDEDKALWATTRYTIRPYAYFDKILVAWTFEKGQPKVKDILTVLDATISFQDGIWIRIKSKVSQREQLLTHTPRKVTGLSVFGWVPYFNELRFASSDWDNPEAPKNLRLSVCFKMQERPDSPLLENIDYITELHVFRRQFPQYHGTRF